MQTINKNHEIIWALSWSAVNNTYEKVNESRQRVDNVITNWINEVAVKWDDEYWFSYVRNQIETNKELSLRQIAYLSRILRVHNMPDLTRRKWNPVNMVLECIIWSDYFRWFDRVSVPEVVNEFETFELFNFPKEHVARRPSDSYFIDKNDETPQNSILLRPHTSVMWKYVIHDLNWKEVLDNWWELKILSFGKVYRVDDIDPTHHECFHQIDWLKITDKEKEIITQDTLKEVLLNIIHSIFWESIEYRFNFDAFPYTQESLEVEVMFNWKRLEVLGAWIVHPSVMEKLWIDSEKYNGWAFWFGIERLAMALKKIPDIRLFWSKDERVTKQWWNFEPYKEVSNLPPVYKDISFIVPKTKFIKNEEESEKSGDFELKNEADLFDLAWIVRDVAWDLVEEVKIVDMFENAKKFWEDKKSVCIRITFRSLERTLTNEEINILYFQIRENIEKELEYVLR